MAAVVPKKKIYLFKAPPEVVISGQAPQSPRKDDDEDSKISPKKDNVYDDDRFVSHFKSVEDIDVELVPTLAFKFSNLADLWSRLQTPSEYGAVVFTSERCVRAVKEALAEGFNGEKVWTTGLMQEWANKYLFSVGPATSSAIKTLFPPPLDEIMINVVTGADYHAESLAEMIIEVNATEAFGKPLLYPCGSAKRDVLQKMLQEEDIECQACVVYETIKHPGIFGGIQKLMDEIKNFRSYLVFFSPSGVKYVFEHLSEDVLNDDQNLLVAIGMTTKVALEEALLNLAIERPVVTCEAPTPEALMDVVKTL